MLRGFADLTKGTEPENLYPSDLALGPHLDRENYSPLGWKHHEGGSSKSRNTGSQRVAIGDFDGELFQDRLVAEPIPGRVFFNLDFQRALRKHFPVFDPDRVFERDCQTGFELELESGV